ncbi:protein spaetzle-like [Halictus rubicundus]|uniref:protein spaetzle-like n=1 Tax=Halictus rubicundus TaxID=77578 RepID=UPI004036F30F
MRALKISIFFWISNNVHCQMQLYEQSHRSFFEYKSLDKEPSVSHNDDSDIRISPRIGLKWPFSTRKGTTTTPEPLSNSNSDDYSWLPNNKFLFPENESDKLQTASVPVYERTTFCENDSNYPMDLVSEAIAKLNLPPYKNVDEIDVTFPLFDRHNESLCDSEEKVILPRCAESIDSEWLHVVNHPKYIQGVRVEICRNEGERCKMVESFSASYISTCEQKYVYRQLSSYKDGKIEKVQFRFPANCCCKVKRVDAS